MANTIRIKRGLSSNVASASLIEGELALTTDTLELYTNNGTENVKLTQKGESGVYVGTEAPTDDSVVWIDPTGTGSVLGLSLFIVNDTDTFDLDGRDAGIYIINPSTRSDEGYVGITYGAPNNSSSTNYPVQFNSMFIIPDKIQSYEGNTYVDDTILAYYYTFKNSNSVNFGPMLYIIKYDTSSRYTHITTDVKSTPTRMLSSENEETISKKKTFSVLPESSVTPTTDRQLVNKKYVDDTVAANGGGGNTYSISKSGTTITLTGSDGSTSSVTDSNTTYNNATASAAGLMSSAHYSKLQNLPDNEHLQWAYPFEDYFWGDVDTEIDWTTFKLDYTTGASMNLYLGEAHTTVDGVTMNLPKGTHCVATCDNVNNVAVLWFLIPTAIPSIRSLVHNYSSDTNTVYNLLDPTVYTGAATPTNATAGDIWIAS